MGRYTPVDKKYFEKQKEERLGQTNITHQGRKITIVEYNSATDIVVEFEDGTKKKSAYKDFKLGTIRYPGSKLVRNKPLEEERKNMIVTSNEGYEMFITQYNSSGDIIVEFIDDYHGQVHTAYKCFVKGDVKNPFKPGKYGEITGNKYSTKENGKKLKEYNIWRGILTRVFEPYKYEHTHTYANVGIDKDWLYFPNFYEWIHNQPNYEKWKNDEEYWDIDKDILSDPNNKKYSPDTCCLVPKYINTAIARNKSENKNDGLPLGVYKKSKNTYIVRINHKTVSFNSVEEAFTAYKEYKSNSIKELAERALNNGDITEKCYQGLLEYDYFAGYKDYAIYK